MTRSGAIDATGDGGGDGAREGDGVEKMVEAAGWDSFEEWRAFWFTPGRVWPVRVDGLGGIGHDGESRGGDDQALDKAEGENVVVEFGIMRQLCRIRSEVGDGVEAHDSWGIGVFWEVAQAIGLPSTLARPHGYTYLLASGGGGGEEGAQIGLQVVEDAKALGLTIGTPELPLMEQVRSLGGVIEALKSTGVEIESAIGWEGEALESTGGEGEASHNTPERTAG